MNKSFFRTLVTRAQQIVTQPRQELTRWQQAARYLYDLALCGSRQLQHDRAPQMAAALAFRALFALVPVLIVGMIVVRALRGTDVFLELTDEWLAALNLNDVQLVLSETNSTSVSLAEWLKELVSQAASVNLTGAGWFGFAMIGYAAISLMVTIENGFNIIYRAPTGRSWFRRVPIYWFVLTVSPVAFACAWYVNLKLTGWVGSVPANQTLFLVGGVLYRLATLWFVLLAIYALLPNTTVRLPPAMAGAAVAALLIEGSSGILQASLSTAFSISQLYGSLGLVPLFMFWVYVMWLFILFGLEVSAILQTLNGRRPDTIKTRPLLAGFIDPTAVITTMELLASRFAAGQPTDAANVEEQTGIPQVAAAALLERLAQERYLHRVDGQSGQFTLALPPEQVTAEQLIQIGFAMVDEGKPTRSPFVEQLRHAQLRLAADTPLSALG